MSENANNSNNANNNSNNNSNNSNNNLNNNSNNNSNNSSSNNLNNLVNNSNSVNYYNSNNSNVNVSNLFVPPPVIVNYSLNETIDISGAQIRNQQGQSADGTEVTYTQFSTDLSGTEIVVEEKLVGLVEKYYDDAVNPLSEKSVVLNEIRDYASKIQCTDFQGKGTIDDYSALFEAASKIASDTKQMQLNVDVEGFDDFGKAADDLSKLFNSFIVKLQTVNIIDDMSFLRSISAALAKIWNLSEVFGNFKKTILATASVEIPKSAHDTSLLVQNVMSNVNCAMSYINHFVDSSQSASSNAKLSAKDKNIIDRAVSTIDNWSILCDQGVTIAMSNNPDVILIKNASEALKAKSLILKNNTELLRSKLAFYNILQ